MQAFKYQLNTRYQADIVNVIKANVYSDNPNQALNHLYNQFSKRLVFLEKYYPQLIQTLIPKQINVFKSYYLNRKKVIDYVKQLKHFNDLSRGHYLGKLCNVYFYKFTLTNSTNASSVNPYVEYYSNLTKNNQRLRKHGIRFLVFHVVNKFNNIHSHGVIISNHQLHLSNLETNLDEHTTLNKATWRIKPLLNYDTNNQVVISDSNFTDYTNYNAIQQWLLYCFKSNKLPFLKDSKDYDSWTKLNQLNFIIRVITLTSNQRTYYFYSFKRKIHSLTKQIRLYKQVAKRLSIIRFEFAKYDVSQQLTLPIKSTVVINNETNSTEYTWIDLIHSKQQKIHAKEILKRGRISYKQACKPHTRVEITGFVESNSRAIHVRNRNAKSIKIISDDLKLFNSS